MRPHVIFCRSTDYLPPIGVMVLIAYKASNHYCDASMVVKDDSGKSLATEAYRKGYRKALAFGHRAYDIDAKNVFVLEDGKVMTTDRAYAWAYAEAPDPGSTFGILDEGGDMAVVKLAKAEGRPFALATDLQPKDACVMCGCVLWPGDLTGRVMGELACDDCANGVKAGLAHNRDVAKPFTPEEHAPSPGLHSISQVKAPESSDDSQAKAPESTDEVPGSDDGKELSAVIPDVSSIYGPG